MAVKRYIVIKEDLIKKMSINILYVFSNFER